MDSTLRHVVARATENVHRRAWDAREGLRRLGSKVTVEGEGNVLELGADCMVAYDVEVRTSDEHSILDASSGERLNPDKNVRIGEHVWVLARS